MFVCVFTFWILRSMLSGRLKRNLNLCRTLRALRVESALSFRPSTSWNRVSAVSLAPTRQSNRHIEKDTDRKRERDRDRETHTHRDRQTEKHTQRDRPTERQRQTDRE